jgi:hypothetical protein
MKCADPLSAVYAATCVTLCMGVLAVTAPSHATPSDATPSDATSDLIRNGSFERPRVTDPWVAFFPDGGRIPGWEVTQGSVDVVSTDWPAARGKQSLGLNGFGPGTIRQRVDTDPGQRYRLGFLLWGDPNGPPSRSRLAVLWDGGRVRTLEVDVGEQPIWRRVTLVVRANSERTELAFRGLTVTNAGPALDDIRLTRVRRGGC